MVIELLRVRPEALFLLCSLLLRGLLLVYLACIIEAVLRYATDVNAQLDSAAIISHFAV